MADALAPIIPRSPRRSSSRSPHKHTLRPRRFQRPSFSPKASSSVQLASMTDTDKLRSPLQLADGKGNSATGAVPNMAAKLRGRGGAMLFPSSPDGASGAATKGARTSGEGLKKLATSLSGAFTVKGSSARTKQGFDLSDWNHDLAAIASYPSSSSPLDFPGQARPTSSLARISTVFPTHISSDDLVTPTANPYLPTPTLTRALEANTALEPPTSSNETSRRKSDEMEDEDRGSYQATAAPVRRDSHHSSRPHSLAHAHTLRSSRTLSHHSLVDSPRVTPVASTSSAPPASPSPFTHSFSKLRSSRNLSDDSHAGLADRPSKKMSVEGMGSLADRSDDEDDEDDDGSNSDASVFGGGGSISFNAQGKKPHRARSRSRSSNPLFAPPIISASNSHPGWSGDGFGTATPRTRTSSHGSTNESLLRSRSRTASAASALDTLSESGPAVDYFSVPVRDAPMGSLEGGLVDNERGGSRTLTPARRKSEAFSLFGAGGPRKVKVIGEGEGSRRTSMPDMMNFVDDGVDPRSQVAHHTPLPHSGTRRISHLHHDTVAEPSAQPFPSRRAASHDSLFLASVLHDPSPASPYGRPSPHGNPSAHNLRDLGGGRKRNANGALLVGTGATSNLAAASPIVARSSSPAPWHARETDRETDEEEEDEDETMEDDPRRDDGWGRSLSPVAPALTDDTGSASSSLSTALSTHADEPPRILDGTIRLRQSISGTNSSLSPGGYFTPQNYKNVRPLQAAFMSTGLVSKRSRARDSGIGLGSTPVPNLLQQLQRQVDNRLEDAGMHFDDAAPPMVHPALVATRASVMPDTPVKRAAFAHPPPAPSLSSLSSPVVAMISLPSDSTPVVSSSPDATRIAPTTLSPPDLKSDTVSSISPCSGRSGGSVATLVEISPTHAARSSTRLSSRGGTWKRPALFRRRSGGQLSTGGSFLGRSGSSSGSNASFATAEAEPMTPTRSVGSAWSDGASLLHTALFPC